MATEKTKCLFIVSHGNGAQLMAVAVIGRELAAKYKEVWICSAYKWYADMLEKELENVHSIRPEELTQLCSTIMRDPSEWMLFNEHPYNDGAFAMRREHFYETYRRLVGLPQKDDFGEGGASKSVPHLIVDDVGVQQNVQQFVQQHNNFVLMQIAGGQPLMNPQQVQQPYPTEELGLKRRYPMKEAQKIVDGLHSRGFEVIQYKLPNEPGLQGAATMTQPVNNLVYMELAKFCKCVITIDSSLMHIAIDNAPAMIVMWGQTGPESFGYDKAVNILPENYEPTSPLMAGVPDTPYVRFASAAKVLCAFDKVMNIEGTFPAGANKVDTEAVAADINKLAAAIPPDTRQVAGEKCMETNLKG